MNLPPLNTRNMQLAALWFIFAMFLVLAWHFSLRQL